jgi:hypothetical protein
LSSDALGDEGAAPDDGDEQEGEVGFEAHGLWLGGLIGLIGLNGREVERRKRWKWVVGSWR